eukprot:m.109071 g.109071  ORF g.109071 m.109071 type:complete len:320 (+) comp12725_c0_seq1:2387-3346(+)
MPQGTSPLLQHNHTQTPQTPPLKRDQNAPLSIYDPEEDISSKYVALPEEKNDLHPIVTQCRVAVFSVLDSVKEVVTKVENKCNKAQTVYKGFMSHVPNEEKSPLNLLVVGVAGMTGSLTFPHRPFIRRFVMVPTLLVGSSFFCFPQTSKYVLQTGLHHTGHDVDLDVVAEDPTELLPSFETVTSHLSSGFDQFSKFIASKPEVTPLSPKIQGEIKARRQQQPNTEKGAVNDDGILVEDIDVDAIEDAMKNIEHAPETTENSSSDEIEEGDIAMDLKGDSNSEDDIVMVVSTEKNDIVEEPEGDFGQGNKEDMDSYPKRG